MINKDRIVQVSAIDLISLYGLILQQNNATLAAVDSSTVDGQFEITAASTPLIADEPVQSVDFTSSVSSATLYFVPALDYAGFTKAGVAVTPTGDVEPDGRSLYKAVLASGGITITKVGF